MVSWAEAAVLLTLGLCVTVAAVAAPGTAAVVASVLALVVLVDIWGKAG